jgi:outer membrane receptor protein involved in Fe transport
MYTKLLTFILLLCVCCIQAENKPVSYLIAGQAIEQGNGNGVPFATVTLQNDSTKVLKRISCDVNGKFTLSVNAKRKYVVILSAMGYKETRLNIDVTELKTDVGKVKMEDGVMMKEVAIVAQKPLVKVDPDKITYSIESDPDAQTNNTLEMLHKVPLISVDADDNVTLNGQSNFKVLVNGKSSTMMSKNFKEVIKSIPANTIKDIEVITNPSSKYDAEGVGGIINIITAKKSINGYNGSISTGFDSRGSLNGSVYLTTKINKFSFSARYSANQFKQPESESSSTRQNFLSETNRFTNTSSIGKYHGVSSNFSGEGSYDIDSLNLISMSFWGYQGSYFNNNSSNSSDYSTQNVLTRYFENTNTGKSTYGTISGNIDYQRTYKKPDKTFTVSYKLDNNPSITNNDMAILNTFNYTPYRQHSTNDAFSREQTLQVDYFDPLTEMHQIECGVKAIYRQNNSNSDTYLLNGATNIWEQSLSKSNELNYNQYILGAYAGYEFKLKKFTAKAGLRSEFTWNNAVSKSDTTVRFNNRLQNVVPYVTLSYEIKTGQTLKASFTQRLNRPGIWYLNPYIDNTDPLNIQYGNPNLKSEIANSYELEYSTFTPKFNLNFTGSGSFTNNSIEEITTIDAAGVRSTTFKNIGVDKNIGLNIYSSYRPNPNISIYFNGGGSYEKMEANNGNVIKSEGFNYRGSFGTRLVLWKNSSLNANGGIYSPGIRLQEKSATYYYTSIGISQSLINKKLMLSLSMSEPLQYKKLYKSDYNDVNFIMHSENTYLARRIRFSATFNFGKMGLEVKKAKRGISNDDVKSGGGGGNSGGN